MVERESVVASLLVAAGGEWYGLDKLHHAVYLIDQLVFGSGFRFDYEHDFGPHSVDLLNAVADARAFCVIEQKPNDERYEYHLVLKSIPVLHGFGELSVERSCRLMRLFAEKRTVVLELAATIDWTWFRDGIVDWYAALVKRKTIKAQSPYMQGAVHLLGKIGLAPLYVADLTFLSAHDM